MAATPFTNVFEPTTELERFVHSQQFWVKGNRVDYENSSYSRYLSVPAFTPYRDPELLNLFINLPSRLQHDGRPKTVIRKMIKLLSGTDYPDGLQMTSPQREFLRMPGEQGGFGSLVDYLIDNSILVELGVVDYAGIKGAYADYIMEYDRVSGTDEFASFTSYDVWKFFSTELWLNWKVGRSLPLEDLGLKNS